MEKVMINIYHALTLLLWVDVINCPLQSYHFFSGTWLNSNPGDIYQKALSLFVNLENKQISTELSCSSPSPHPPHYEALSDIQRRYIWMNFQDGLLSSHRYVDNLSLESMSPHSLSPSFLRSGNLEELNLLGLPIRQFLWFLLNLSYILLHLSWTSLQCLLLFPSPCPCFPISIGSRLLCLWILLQW